MFPLLGKLLADRTVLVYSHSLNYNRLTLSTYLDQTPTKSHQLPNTQISHMLDKTHPTDCNERKDQCRITNWTTHRPFIPGVTKLEVNHHTSPTHHNQLFDQHLSPFGTHMPNIDSTKVLRVVYQNPQYSFQLFGDGIEISHTIANLINLDAQMFVSSSPSVNWHNKKIGDELNSFSKKYLTTFI